MQAKKTLILGATPNPSRYAYTAAHMLNEKGYPIIPLGIKKGELAGETILNGFPPLKDIDTVTVYIGPRHQHDWYDYILSLNPRRIIFNPGTERGILQEKAESNGVEVVEACTLVMLSIGNY